MSNSAWRRQPGAGSVPSSVDNALRLLELIGEQQTLRVSEAAALLGVAPSTAHRLLSALRGRGFVLQDKPNGVYRPGPVLNEIGLAAIGRIDLRSVAHPVLRELSEQTQETVSLTLLEGRDVRFVDCVESPRSVRVGDRTGVVMPAHCTAAGKAILAALPPFELERRYRDHSLTGRTPHSITAWERLEAELRLIRRHGYALNEEEGEEGICAVAVAVRDLTDAPLASIAVVLPAARTAKADVRTDLVPLLERAVKTVQGLLRARLQPASHTSSGTPSEKVPAT
ncbi:IclR family transcriptional regulator [Actinomadura sp. NBRC 104412]|uniref:IclR family transcriptional regulator n=1 Tax=Actinomadura sp. NBRC 104412 TaxID=3032203 RepID=UPI0024A18509|nr:IclR family transcriptional regulator [Actinomadura sp. NBRC 104412]GLZ05538.1 IclR family transcriptional regulator [Actinomadura sp. NBRC 104412]